MLKTASRVYERVLNDKLRTVIEVQLEDHIFKVKQLIKENRNKDIYVAFIDLLIAKKQDMDQLEKRRLDNKFIDNKRNLNTHKKLLQKTISGIRKKFKPKKA